MAKRDQYFEQAQELYVVKQLSFEAVARELGLGEKTVRNWAKEGGWAEKRAELLRKSHGMHEMLYDTAHMLAESIRDDLAGGKPVEPGRLYALKQLVEILKKSHEYERESGATEKPEEPAKREFSLTAEKLAEVKQILNL